MNARFILLIVALCTSLIGSSKAEDGIKPARIGMLLPGSEASSAYLQGLYRGLAEQGLVDGKTISLEYRYAKGRIDQLPALAGELVASGVDLIFTSGDEAGKAAKQATSKIPIVAVTCDALAAGLVSNLRRPGENLTGVTCINADLDGKRVELIGEILRPLPKLGVLLSEDRRSLAELKEVERAAEANSIVLVRQTVATANDIGSSFAQAASTGVTGMVVVYNPTFFLRRRELADFALRGKIATAFNFREFVEAGGLISYGPNVQDMCRQSARLIKKVLGGAVAGEIPMEQPARFELVINLKTANALGLAIPASLIARADEVLE